MNNREQKSRLYRDIKTLTTILVVMGHVIVMYTANGAIPVSGRSLLLQKLTDFIYSFHIPLFYIVTGAVFGYCIENGKYKDSKGFIINKCRKLLVPYLVFGVFYVTPVMKYVGLLNVRLGEYIEKGILLSRNPRHLWFLMALFWIYVSFVPMKELIRKKTIWGMVAAGAVCLFIYKCAYEMPQDYQIRRACLDQHWFYMGMLFHYSYDFLSPFWNWAGKATSFLSKVWNCPVMMKISRNSFGIYLIHPMIIYVSFHWLGQSQIHPVILSIGIFGVAMMFSVIGTELIRKIGLEFVIGE